MIEVVRERPCRSEKKRTMNLGFKTRREMKKHSFLKKNEEKWFKIV